MANSVLEIDTKGTCLFCLNPNCVPFDKSGSKFDVTTATAFKMLFRYLKIDIRKVHTTKTSFAHDSFINLAVNLCDTCFFLIDEFLELYQNFERIRMQLEHCTWRLRQYIEKGEKDGDRVREYRRRTGTGVGSGLAEQLRKETLEKCSYKLNSSQPKIPVNKSEAKILLKRNRASAIGRSFCSLKSEDISESITVSDIDIPMQNLIDDTINSNSKLTSECHNSKNELIGGMSSTRNEANSSEQLTKVLGTLQFEAMMSVLSEPLPDWASEQELNDSMEDILEKSRQVVKNNKKLWICPLCDRRRYEKSDVKIHILKCHLKDVLENIQDSRRAVGVKIEVQEEEYLDKGNDNDPDPAYQPDNEDNSSEASFGEPAASPVPIIIPPKVRPKKLKKNRIPCDICGKYFINKNSLNCHKYFYHSGKPLAKCDVCGKSFTQAQSMRRHKIAFHTKNPHRKFQTSASPHATNFGQSKKFKCNLCGSCFAYPRKLKAHRLEFHAKETPALECDHCLRPFLDEVSLANHKKTLHFGNRKEKPVGRQCALCEEPFRDKGNLRRHNLLTHTRIVLKDKIPDDVSDASFDEAVAALMGKMVLVASRGGADNRQICECFICKRRFRKHGAELKLHILRCHLERAVEDAMKRTNSKLVPTEDLNEDLKNSGPSSYPLEELPVPVNCVKLEELDLELEEGIQSPEDPLSI